MARTITPKQKKFAKAYLETGKKAESALIAYDTDDIKVAAVIASENLNKPNVREYLESKANKAAEFVFQLAESSENDGVRLGASKDILDRSGYKPVERSVSINLNADSTDRTQELGNQLVRLFGRGNKPGV